MKALEGDDFRLVLEHLARFPHHECPVCSTKRWFPLGVETPMSASTAFQLHGLPPDRTELVVPLVVVACETCFFVRLFLWAPIEKKLPTLSHRGGP